MDYSQSFAKIHPRFQTPGFSTMVAGFLVAIPSLFMEAGLMTDLASIGTLFAFILVCIGVIVLRYKQPNRPRASKTPFVPLVPLLGIGSCLYLMAGLPWVTWVRFGVWLLVGLVVYMLFGFRRSRVGLSTRHEV